MLKIVLFTSLLFHLQCQAAQIKNENVLEFVVCPQSHPKATNRGRQCKSLNDETIKCKSSRCENFSPGCDSFPSIKGLPGYEKSYFANGYLEANRPIFQADDKCIWWHYPKRNWWIGPCEKVGTNSGFAYLEEDLECPFHQPSTWRNCGTGEIIKDLSFSLAAASSS